MNENQVQIMVNSSHQNISTDPSIRTNRPFKPTLNLPSKQVKCPIKTCWMRLQMAAGVPSKHPDCPIKTYLVSRLGISESSHQNTLVIYRRGLYAH